MATATIGFCDYRCDWFCRGYPAIKFVVASRYNKVCCGFFAPTQFTAIFLAVTKRPKRRAVACAVILWSSLP